MIIYSNRFTKKHVIGGSGIMDTLRNILKKAAASSASKSSLALMKKMASSELGREAMTAAKSAGKELVSSAISTAKNVAIDKGKKTMAKVYAITKTPVPAASDPNTLAKPETTSLTKKSKDILSELINGSSKSGETNSLGSYESMFGGSLRFGSFATKPSASATKPSARAAHSASASKNATKKVTKENAIRKQDLVQMGREMMRT